MASGILRCNSDGVFGSNGCCLAQDAVTNLRLYLFDLLNRLLLIEPMNKEVNIGSWGKLIMVI